MYSSFQLTKKYFHYYFTAYNSKGHGMHSPFVFQFILQVLNNKAGHVAPKEIEHLRKTLLHDQKILDVEDFGAGSRVASHRKRSIAELAKNALKPKKYAQLLFRVVKYYKPQTILELGTSLGVTTAYFAAANPSARVITIEGSRAIADAASKNFATLQLKNIRQHIGNFDEVLPAVLKQHASFDLVYVDGNHRYEPTIRYFQQLLPAMHNDSILVFDDIHWSAEMEKAWAEIRQHPSVQCTVDVFFLGFVFFRNEFKEQQHFSIRY